MKTLKDSFCSYCGVQFIDDPQYPKKCSSCGEYAWGNPIPVVVILFTVENQGKTGVLIQQRNINPEKGKWALTGGYVNNKEDWREAAVRETMEELKLETNPNKFELVDVIAGKNSLTLLIICKYNEPISYEILSSFEPNEEVQALDVMWEPRELAFSVHTKFANDFIK